MIVENIRKKGRNVLINFDNSESEVIKYEVFLSSDIYKGKKITAEDLENIKFQNELFSAKETALRILARRTHSVLEIKTKLRRKEFGTKIIALVLEYLFDRNFLDDEKFAEAFARERIEIRKQGTIKVKNELRKKGVTSEIAEEVLNKYKDDSQVKENAVKIVQKKYQQLVKRGKYPDYKIKQKVLRHLLTKGYNYEISLKAYEVVDKEE